MPRWKWGCVALMLCTGCASQGGREETQSAHGADAPTSGDGECRREELIGPIVVGDATYASRHGVGVKRFGQLVTSPDRPLEECGLEAVLTRLSELTCDDGTNPFGGDLGRAHRSRAGNVGPGGRCGAFIDRYEVPCPEGTYSVFADLYICSADTVDSWR